jgi:Protein of unknown function (DUF1566)/PEP-CTERM motif
MKKIVLALIGTTLTLLASLQPARATAISVGPYTASTTMPFVVPVRITGAVDLTSWTFDLAFDASDLMVNTACDPFTDTYCSLTTGPVTEGPFFSGVAMFPTLFLPGFIVLDSSLAQTGRLLGVYGAWQDPLPGVSGDGILAYIEFVVRPGGTGTTPITIVGPTSVPEPESAALIGIGLLALLLRRVRSKPQSESRRFAERALASAVAAVALLHAPTVFAQTTANGPYYATPSWDQSLPAGSRFLVLSNFNSDAVLDRETGLVWQRSPRATRFTYAIVNNLCGTQTTGNRGGWRLPNNAELASLFDPSSTTADGLPAGHPFLDVGTRADVFWSSTPNGSGRAGAGTTAAGTGYAVVLYAFLPDTTQFRPWCVRASGGASG